MSSNWTVSHICAIFLILPFDYVKCYSSLSNFCRNSKVNCLYFVAKGTLDDVLWKLIEKKFRDLGPYIT